MLSAFAGMDANERAERSAVQCLLRRPGKPPRRRPAMHQPRAVALRKRSEGYRNLNSTCRVVRRPRQEDKSYLCAVEGPHL